MTDAAIQPRRAIDRPALTAAGAILVGWLALYGPVYLDFAAGAWTRDENAHAPFVIAICVGALYARLAAGALAPAPARDAIIGAGIFGAGLALYAAGRAKDAELFSSASQGVVALGLVFCLFGAAGARRLWFPLAMTVYLIVWPGWAIDAATAPLKQAISNWVSGALFASGLPVANSGAVISVGSYELLIADACAGLNSLIALTAVGVVYLYLVKRRSRTVNIIVLASLVPLAIAANLARVAILVLITYYAGYDAGQSFLHETAGLLMFGLALIGVFAVDWLAAKVWERPA